MQGLSGKNAEPVSKVEPKKIEQKIVEHKQEDFNTLPQVHWKKLFYTKEEEKKRNFFSYSFSMKSANTLNSYCPKVLKMHENDYLFKNISIFEKNSHFYGKNECLLHKNVNIECDYSLVIA